jgi:hypothetical protein
VESEHKARQIAKAVKVLAGLSGVNDGYDDEWRK